MKTPKRQYTFPVDSLNYPGLRGAFEGEEVPSAHALQCERWKRKNRMKQLKRSLEKYKDGTHLSGSVAAAYRRLQRAVRPGKHATITEWAKYLQELRRIQEHITHAISNTAILLAYDAERKVKDRKEHSE
jgi:hypothetical protein